MEEAASPAAGLAAGDANLLILISVLSLLAWFADLCRRILHMYSLSAAVASGGLVRLEPDRSISELQMLWNMNMRQQLLRARRASAGVAVSQIQVPWSVKDVRCSAHAGADGRRAMRLRFSYTGTAAASAQLFWGMETGAVQRLIRRANLSAPGGHCGGRAARASLFTLLRKNAWSRFGNRYTAVQNRETAAGSAGADALSMDGHLLEASVGFFGAGSRSALFKDHECVGRSEPFAVPAGRDCVFEEEVPLASARERADLGSEGRGGGAAGLALHDDRGLGSTRVGGEAADEAESGQTADAQLDILREGDGGEIGAAIGDAAGTSAWNETSGNEDREAPLFPLVIAVSFDEEAAGPTEQPSHGALGSREEVKHVLYVVAAGPAASLPAHLQQTVLITSRATYVTQDIYGEDAEEDDMECIICLTEPKDITLLPCRHHCVCASCMSRLEQCPVCRGSFVGYLRTPPSPPPRCSAEAAELGDQITV